MTTETTALTVQDRAALAASFTRNTHMEKTA